MKKFQWKVVYSAGYAAIDQRTGHSVWVVVGHGSTIPEAKHALANKLCVIGKMHEDYAEYQYREEEQGEYAFYE